MNKKLMIMSATLSVLVLILGTNSSAYAIWGHGASYGPSFGGGAYYSQGSTCVCVYNDGLKINDKVFDVSKPGTTIPTQTLYIGASNKINVKIFSNSGTYAIQGGAILFNVKGSEPRASDSDTWVQFDKYGGVIVRDPHNILGKVKVDIFYDKNYMHVRLMFTPKSPMSTSDMILEAWDYRLSVGTTTVVNAVNVSYVPQGYH